MTVKYAIDFGTTDTSMAIAIKKPNGTYQLHECYIDQSKGSPSPVMRSVFYVDVNGDIHIGGDAEREWAGEYSHGVFSEKRLIKEFKMLLSENNSFSLKVGNRVISAVDLLSALFQKIKPYADEKAKNYHLEYNGVVLGVPVGFSEAIKNLYLQALVNAGYYKTMTEAVHKTLFVSEPVAVAVNYGEKLTEEKRVMVFDYGGGTLDIAVMDLKEQIGKNDKLHPHKVIGMSSGYRIGGEQMNQEFFINCLLPQWGEDNIKKYLNLSPKAKLTPDELWQAISRSGCGLDKEIEQAKIKLSGKRTQNKILIADYPIDIVPPLLPGGKILPPLTVNRQDFETAIQPIIPYVKQVIEECLDSCEAYKDEYGNLNPVFPNRISEVLLAGGSSLIPYINRVIGEYFDKDIIEKNVDKALLPSDEVLLSVVRGLSIIGSTDDAIIDDDILECSYGIWDAGLNAYSEIIPQGTKISEIETDDIDDYAGLHDTFTTTTKPIGSSTLKIKIMQKTKGINNTDIKELKEIRINLDNRTGCDFDIYFSIDKKLKMLVMKIYFIKQKRFCVLSVEQSKISINI